MQRACSGSTLIRAAKDMATRAHQGQFRKGKLQEPYIRHPEEVAELVKEAGGSTIEIAASYLHDVVEDTSLTLYEVRQYCGEEVGDLVEELTDPSDIEHGSVLERKKLQASQYQDASSSAKRVKLGDQISNLRSLQRNPPPWTQKNKREYIHGAHLVAVKCRDASPHLWKIFQREYSTVRKSL
jgi:(p)ppGpp synthase/HD superfamily hydrolase